MRLSLTTAKQLGTQVTPVFDEIGFGANECSVTGAFNLVTPLRRGKIPSSLPLD